MRRSIPAMTNTTTPASEHVASGGHPPICPECAAGKHPNCAGTALDETVDEIVPCACPDRTHMAGA